MPVDRLPEQGTERHVSTGALPSRHRVQALVDAAVERYRPVGYGQLSAVYPTLLEADPGHFGVCLTSVSGASCAAGDADVAFPLMSVAKPFTFALVAQRLGVHGAKRRLGVDATGLPFNSLAAVERSPDGTTNPLVNPGAIAAVGLVPGGSAAERWAALHEGLSRFAGRELPLDGSVLESAMATNQRNRSIAQLLDARGLLEVPADEVVESYTRQSCLSVTARDLAVMGATLADGGVNPVTGERVVGADSCRAALSVMATAGLYESSGSWLYDVGIPAKSGIGGGMVAAAPGKGGLATFSPLLDDVGNSVRGQLAVTWLSTSLGLDLFWSTPAVPAR
jgi:glutaminase